MEGNTSVLANLTSLLESITETYVSEIVLEANPNKTILNETTSDGQKNLPLPLAAARFTTAKVAFATHHYVLPFIVFIGLIGNALSFIIMLKPHNRRISCCNYIAALAISDSLMLLNALVYWTVSFKTRQMWSWECKTMAWLFQALSLTSVAFIFAMTVDRFLAIRFPFKARMWCSTHRARIAIAVISMTILLYTLPYLFTAKLIPAVRTCVAVSTTDALSKAYNWINIFLGSIVPFVGLLTMNGFIIVTVRRRAHLSETSSSSKISSVKESKIGAENPTFEPEESGHKIVTNMKNEGDEDENPKHETNENCIDNPNDPNTINGKSIPSDHDRITEGNVDACNDISYKDSSNSHECIGKTSVNGCMNTNENSNPSSHHTNGEIEGKPIENKKVKTSPSSKLKRRNTKGSKDNQLTIMLLLITFTFLLLTLPQYVRYLVAVFWNYTTRAEDYASFLLLAHASNRFFYMNSACNFFLYCMSGNKFRQDVKNLFTFSTK